MTQKILMVAVSVLVMIVSACSDGGEPQSPANTTQSAATSHDVLIRNVMLIDTQNGLRGPLNIAIDGEEITRIAPPSDEMTAAQVVDGTGQFLIPGLWDTHVHVTFTPGIDHTVFYPLSTAYGVTYLRDTGGHLDALAPAIAAAENDPLAPEFFFAGPLIDGEQRVYSGERPGFPDISVGVVTAEDAEAAVTQMAEAGATMVKAYEMLTPEAYTALHQAAKARGLALSAHVPLSMTAQDVASLGRVDLQHMRNLEMGCAADYRALALERLKIMEAADTPGSVLRANMHSAQRVPAIEREDPTVCDALLKQMAENEVWVTPTLTITLFLTHRIYGEADYRDSFSLMPNDIAESWAARSSLLLENPPSPPAVISSDWANTMVPRLQAAGVPMMAGTDAPIGFLTPGRSLHEELRLLVEAGLDPADALHTATLAPAQYLGLDDTHGLIEEGYAANLVLLGANPLDDIRHTQNINAVGRNGTVLSRDTLDRMLREPTTP